jgi:hypothetical protein
MKPRPIALAASRLRRYSALKNRMAPDRCASASATSIRETDAPARCFEVFFPHQYPGNLSQVDSS